MRLESESCKKKVRVESESDLIEPRGTWLALIAGRMKDTLGQGESPFTFHDDDDHHGWRVLFWCSSHSFIDS